MISSLENPECHCGTEGEETYIEDGYSCPNPDCGVDVFGTGTGEMPGLNADNQFTGWS